MQIQITTRTETQTIVTLKSAQKEDSISDILTEMQQMGILDQEKAHAFTANTESLVELVATVVRPVFLVETSEKALHALFNLEDRIKKLIPGNNSDALIDAYEPKNEEKKVTLQDLLETMEKSPLFFPEEQEFIAVWKATVTPENLMKIALAALISNVLDPALLRSNDKSLHSMLKGLKEILAQHVKDPEAFIHTYKKLVIKQELLTLCLHEGAKEVNDEMIAQQEKNKETLLELKEARKSMGEMAANLAFAVGDKVLPLTKTMIENETEITDLANRLEACHQNFQANTRNCHDMLRKI